MDNPACVTLTSGNFVESHDVSESHIRPHMNYITKLIYLLIINFIAIHRLQVLNCTLWAGRAKQVV